MLRVYKNLQFYFIFVLQQSIHLELSVFLNYPFTSYPTINLDKREYTATCRFYFIEQQKQLPKIHALLFHLRCGHSWHLPHAHFSIVQISKYCLQQLVRNTRFICQFINDFVLAIPGYRRHLEFSLQYLALGSGRRVQAFIISTVGAIPNSRPTDDHAFLSLRICDSPINVEAWHAFYTQEILITAHYSVLACPIAFNSAIFTSTIQNHLESEFYLIPKLPKSQNSWRYICLYSYMYFFKKRNSHLYFSEPHLITSHFTHEYKFQNATSVFRFLFC